MLGPRGLTALRSTDRAARRGRPESPGAASRVPARVRALEVVGYVINERKSERHARSATTYVHAKICIRLTVISLAS